MYERILVAVDGSQCAAKGLDEAIKLAAAFDAELEIVHIVDPGYEEEGVRARLVAEGKKLLADALASAEARNVRGRVVMVDDIDAPGNIASQLRRIVGRSDAQLVVSGTHGRSGLKSLMMGSVAEELVRHSAVPVLLVSQRD